MKDKKPSYFIEVVTNGKVFDAKDEYYGYFQYKNNIDRLPEYLLKTHETSCLKTLAIFKIYPHEKTTPATSNH
jgi:hypothetical protein